MLFSLLSLQIFMNGKNLCTKSQCGWENDDSLCCKNAFYGQNIFTIATFWLLSIMMLLNIDDETRIEKIWLHVLRFRLYRQFISNSLDQAIVAPLNWCMSSFSPFIRFEVRARDSHCCVRAASPKSEIVNQLVLKTVFIAPLQSPTNNCSAHKWQSE